MKRSLKLSLSACVLGIVSIVGMRIPLAPPADLTPSARQATSGESKHESDGFMGHKATSIDPSIPTAPIPHQTKSNRRMQTDSDARMPIRQDDHAEAAMASTPRKSRKFSTPLSHIQVSSKPPASLVWIDGLSAEQDKAVQRLAEEFNISLQALSDQNPTTDYAENYHNEAQLNDIRFQTRHGDLLWMRHHVASHHLNSGASSGK